MIHFKEISYDIMKPFGEDFRVILHEGRRYWALLDESNSICAVCETDEKRESIKVGCLYVPEEKRGHGYAYDLLMHVIFNNQEKYVSAQANDWSIKTFLKAGFAISGTRKCRYWTAYFVHRGPCKAGGENGKTKNRD